MITYYCPNCWNEITEADKVCPHCGYRLQDYARLSLEQKLILSLRHPALDNRMMAVQVLGNIGSEQALAEFERMLADPETDVYLMREVIQALGKIQNPKSAELLERMKDYPSPLIQRLAEEQLRKIKAGSSG